MSTAAMIRSYHGVDAERASLAPRAAWLLLIYQLPPQPAYFRVKIWRRLQAMGAVAIKGAVYALPWDDQTQEDFRWLVQEIVSGGGEVALCEARFVDGLSDQQVRALFDVARDADYEAIAKEAAALDRPSSGRSLRSGPRVESRSRACAGRSPKRSASTSSAPTAARRPRLRWRAWKLGWSSPRSMAARRREWWTRKDCAVCTGGRG